MVPPDHTASGKQAQDFHTMNFIKNLFTERDGVSWCFVRISSAPILLEMMYKFYNATSPVFQDFAVGVAAIFASIGFKNISERDK